MTMARDGHTDNILIGAGELYLERYASGAAQPSGGERYLGDSVSAAIAVTTQRARVDSGDGPIARPLVDIVRSVERTLTFTLHDASVDNFGLYIMDDGAATADTAVKVAAAHVVGPLDIGAWYQIGASAALPGGLGKLKTNTDITVKKSTNGQGGGDAAVAGTDYELDPEAGRIRTIHSSATYLHLPEITAAALRERTKASSRASQIVCALRYIEDSRAGYGRNIYIRKCVLGPTGSAALKSPDTEQRFEFTAVAGAPGGDWPQIAIDGVPVP